jgi:hypothetical protein
MDLTRQLKGKKIAAVFSNGHVLQFRMEDGAEFNVVWLNDNGEPLKGKPVVAQHGFRLKAAGMKDIIHVRQAGVKL